MQDDRVIIEVDFMRRETSFFIERMRGGHYVLVGQKDGQLAEVVVEGLTANPLDIQPLLKLPSHLADFFIKGVVEYAKKTNTLPREDENLLKGKLEATQGHLQDMKNITFKLLKINDNEKA